MNYAKKIGIAALAVISFWGCKKEKPITPDMELTPVYVESGSIIKETEFVSNGPFDANNTAIGMIDSTDCPKYNGYVDKAGWVYVFEGGSIPKKVLNDTKFNRYKNLTEATWQNDYIYKLELDAQICIIPPEFKIYLREKGEYQRQKAKIYNTTVYRFKNRYVIENYKNLLTYHEYLRPNQPSDNLFTALGLSSQEYTASFNGVAFNGIINYNAIPFTPIGQTDKIYFRRNSPSEVNYRLRHIYVKHTREILSTYFDGNQVKREFRRSADSAENDKNRWFIYLRSNVYPKYLEAVIKGYKCDSCPGTKSPEYPADPPPKVGNGF